MLSRKSFFSTHPSFAKTCGNIKMQTNKRAAAGYFARCLSHMIILITLSGGGEHHDSMPFPCRASPDPFIPLPDAAWNEVCSPHRQGWFEWSEAVKSASAEGLVCHNLPTWLPWLLHKVFRKRESRSCTIPSHSGPRHCPRRRFAATHDRSPETLWW